MRTWLSLLLAGFILFPSLTLGVEAPPRCSILELNAEFSLKLSPVEAGQNALLQAFLKSDPVISPSQTANFVDRVAFSDAAGFHYEFGFVALKAMNDIDKNLGTAFSNLGQHLFVESLDEIKSKYPQLARLYNIHSYGDFKTVRIALEARGAETLDDATLNRIFSDLTSTTQQKLRNYLEANSLDQFPIPLEFQNWFVAGAGRSLDESALMARMCRGATRGLCADGFSGFGSSASASLRESVFQFRTDVVRQHQALVNQVKDSPFSATVLNADGTLRREIIEVVRKNVSEPEDLAEAIAPHLGVSASEVPGQLITSLQSYYQLVDRFQPAILVRQRVRLEFPSQGGLSLDVRGMGAVNFMETEAALLRTQNSSQLGDILGEIRQGERAATVRFESIKSRLNEALGPRFEVHCSGDDCVATLKNGQELTQVDKQLIVQRMGDQGLAGDVRMTFVPAGLSNTNSMWLASQMEAMEKTISARLLGTFTPAEIRQITIAVDAPEKQGQLGLLVSVRQGSTSAALAEKLRDNSELIQRLLMESMEEYAGSPGWNHRVPAYSETSVVRIVGP